jgi:hypothetical protein
MNISIAAISYIIEIFLAEGMFLYPLERRKQFVWRLLAAILVCVFCAAFFPSNLFERYSFGRAAINFLRYLFLFSLSMFAMYFCFRAKLWTILSACTAGYAVQHLTQRLSVILDLFIPLFDDLHSPYNTVCKAFLYFIPTYLLFYFLLCRKRDKNYYEEVDVRLNVISIAIMFLCMLVTRIQDFGTQSLASKISNSVYAIICCGCALVLQSNVYSMNKKDRELQIMQQIYLKERDEYKHWQNSIDVINVKCHDLKHRIASLRNNYSENYIREIEDSVMIYDSALKTGNEVIDAILFEKNVFCERNHIEFSYMVDGAALNFLEKEELFALFTNIIDNAIEACLRLEPEKRVIQLAVKHTVNMVFIHEENYYAGEMKLENGFPVTSKEDKDNHGFGIRSMKMFAEKKDGTLQFSAENGIFSLTISIPDGGAK